MHGNRSSLFRIRLGYFLIGLSIVSAVVILTPSPWTVGALLGWTAFLGLPLLIAGPGSRCCPVRSWRADAQDH